MTTATLGAHSKPFMPAASGYTQLRGALTSPAFIRGFLPQLLAESVYGNITSQDVVPTELRKTGDEVIFRLPPAAEVFTYHKNQELMVSELDIATVKMSVGRGIYSNLKIDDVDKAQAHEFAEIHTEYKKQLAQKTSHLIDSEVLTEVPLQSHACNRGARAGKRSRMFNLGGVGAPVILTKDNILQKLGELRTVLAEQNVDVSKLYAVLPTEAQNLFYQNPTLLNAAASGQSMSIVLGAKIPNVFGFDIYFSNRMPQYNENGRVAYTIFAGRKDATGFVMQYTKSEIVRPTNYFGELWRTLNIYDFMVLQPECVSMMYAVLDFSA